MIRGLATLVEIILTDGHEVTIDYRAFEVEIVADLENLIAVVTVESRLEAELRLNGVVDLSKRVCLAGRRRNTGSCEPCVGRERLPNKPVR